MFAKKPNEDPGSWGLPLSAVSFVCGWLKVLLHTGRGWVVQDVFVRIKSPKHIVSGPLSRLSSVWPAQSRSISTISPFLVLRIRH